MKPTLNNEPIQFVDYPTTNPVVFKCLRDVLNCEECVPTKGICEFMVRVNGREQIAKLCQIKFN